VRAAVDDGVVYIVARDIFCFDTDREFWLLPIRELSAQDAAKYLEQLEEEMGPRCDFSVSPALKIGPRITWISA